MNLRQRTILFMTLGFVSLLGTIYGGLFLAVQHRFGRIEAQNAQQNVQRAYNALTQKIHELELLAIDAGVWDDTTEFVSGRQPDYIDRNFDHQTLLDWGVNVFVISDRQGQILAAQSVDLGTEQAIALPPDIPQLLQPHQPLATYHPDQKNHSGLVELSDGILLFASHGIRAEGDEDEEPEREQPNLPEGEFLGTVMVGIMLSEDLIAELERQTELNIEVHSPQTAAVQARLTEILNSIERENPGAMLASRSNHQTLWATTLLQDFQQQPIALLDVVLPRQLHQERQALIVYLTILLVVLGFVFGILILMDLERNVLSRLARLSRVVQTIGEQQDLTQRAEVAGNDELTHLGRAINQMLTQLEESTHALEAERAKAEGLLLNILPESIATQLKTGDRAIAEHFESVTILFADLVGFTDLSARLSAVEVVEMLNTIFSQFDQEVEALGLEKIKTIGDAYMVAAGLPTRREDHADAIAQMALKMQSVIAKVVLPTGEALQIRIGINTGVVIAGVIGTKKFIYDLWGDAVNVASRMESHGEPGRIQTTESTYQQLKDTYQLEARGQINIKGRGMMTTYWLVGPKVATMTPD